MEVSKCVRCLEFKGEEGKLCVCEGDALIPGGKAWLCRKAMTAVRFRAKLFQVAQNKSILEHHQVPGPARTRMLESRL